MKLVQRNCRRFWPGLAALAAVLLLVQSAALTHLDLDDSHTTDGACALCIGAASLAAGNVAAAPCLDKAAESEPVIEFVGFPAGIAWLDHRYARGPPQAS